MVFIYSSNLEEFFFYPLIKISLEMETHSSILAWRMLWTKEPHELPSTVSPRVGLTEKLSTNACSSYNCRQKMLHFNDDTTWSFNSYLWSPSYFLPDI